MSPLAVNNFHFRTRKALQILAVTYVGLTAAEIIGLIACGMGIFDAVTHSFATIATGGFSTKNLSVAHFQSMPIETLIMIFMILSGIHFGLLFAAIQGNISSLWKSSFVRYYILALLIGVSLTALNIHGRLFHGWGETFRYASFQVISLGTSTGFATTDTGIWPAFAQLVLIFFTLQCACAGSTSGGIKVDRMVIFWKSLIKRIKLIIHPHAVISPKIDGMPLEDDIMEAGIQYIVIYLAIVFIATLLLTALNVDALTAFSASAATMGNVGPGFGLVSSMSNFSMLPDTGKWILSITMLLGRLEIFSLILFVMIKSWK
jgi:trk system potassium uptake protein TrkH